MNGLAPARPTNAAPAARATEPLLTVSALSAAYGRRVVLRDVHLAVNDGEFWFLLGPNGEGKSTLLRCILGLLQPVSGSLTLSPTLGGPAGIGFVPQRCDLNPTLPTMVREFVLLGRVGTRTRGRSEREDRLGWALERVGMLEKRSQSYWSLSGGQRQRALVARALVRRPRLLVLDEPTNGLDLPSEESLLSFLSDLNGRDGLTMLFVTHDLAVAARHGSHFALVRDGTVAAGTGKDVLKPDVLRHTFGIDLQVAQDVAGGAATVRLGGA